MGFNIRRLERGWFSQNQPSFNRGLQDTKVGTELLFAKPTVIPTFRLNIRRLECAWLSQIQLSIQPLPLMYEVWKTVDCRESNRHSNHVL